MCVTKCFLATPALVTGPSKELQSLQKRFTCSPFCVAEVGSFYLAVEERATSPSLSLGMPSPRAISPRPACARPPFILMRFQKALL